jgi:KUP system potassium uptake protein
METPNVPGLLAALPMHAIPGPRLEKTVMDTSYYLGRETLLPGGPSGMPRWRKRIFIILARNARPASAFFGLPPNRVVEMGAQVQF